MDAVIAKHARLGHFDKLSKDSGEGTLSWAAEGG